MGLDIFGESNYTNARWIPDPDTRGTSGLILTCSITLALCVSSALHLNVFHRQCGLWMRCLVRAKWILIALLAPEFVVFNAWSQRRHALRIAKMLRKRCGQAEPESGSTTLRKMLGLKYQRPDQEQGMKGSNSSVDHLLHDSSDEEARDLKASGKGRGIGISHGFLIVMGGLVVDMSRDPERVWPTWCNTLTITPACVEDCFTLDVFKDVDLSFLTKESIAGRSKRDYFTKFITSIQAFWFCVQFFVRIHESLPVSLLELNTFAHSVCALITYCLWWHKPSDIDDPFVLYTEHSSALRDLCAAQWTLGASGKHYKKQCISRSSSSSSSSTDDEKVTLSSKWIPSFTHAGSELPMNFFRGRSGITLLPGTGEDWYIFRPNEPRWHYYPRYRDEKRLKLRIISESHHSDYPTTATTLLQSGQRIPGTNEHVDHRFRLVEVDSITLHRWHRALSSHPSSSSAFFRGNYSIWLRDRQPNFVWPRGLDSTDGPAIADELVKSLFTALITSLSYGSLHILAWDSAVLHPNSAEEMLWKISCLNLEVLGPFAFIVWAGLKGWRGPDAHLNLSLGWSVAMGIVTSAAFLAYVLSRVYLVVEAFVVIPYMDPGVYEMPKYAVYFPHVG